MNVFCISLVLTILVGVCAGLEDLGSEVVKLNELIPEIYNVYLEAFKENKNVVTRRFMNNNYQYELHINKLREVNGVKTHNVRISRTSDKDDSLIYINNPVESNIPNAFLTQEQFKQNLMDNIKKQQKEFSKEKLQKSLNMFKFKKEKENKKPFVWSLLKTATNRTKNKNDKGEEELSSTTILISKKETTRDELRDLFKALANSETKSTKKSSTNTPELTHRSTLQDPITINSEPLIKNNLSHTDPPDYGEYVTTTYQEEFNATIGDVATTTADYRSTFADTNGTPSTSQLIDTTVTETSQVTRTGTTKSTPSTRGRPFVFIN